MNVAQIMCNRAEIDAGTQQVICGAVPYLRLLTFQTPSFRVMIAAIAFAFDHRVLQTPWLTLGIRHPDVKQELT